MIRQTYLAYSTDAATRWHASSGGFTKSLLCYLLDTRRVDAVLIATAGQAGFAPEFIITQDPQVIRSRQTSSVYYPVDPFVKAAELREDWTYATTLLPCQVDRLRQLQARGQWGNIRVVVELFCNYTPTPAWTDQQLATLGMSRESLRAFYYRGEGWPGNMLAVSDEATARIAFTKCWVNDVEAHGLLRCRTCSRCWGDSDVVVGDPWWLRKGVGAGKTLVGVQTAMMSQLVQHAAAAGYLVLEDISPEAFERCAGPYRARKQRRQP